MLHERSWFLVPGRDETEIMDIALTQPFTITFSSCVYVLVMHLNIIPGTVFPISGHWSSL